MTVAWTKPMSQRFIAPFAIVLLIAASLACSTLRLKRSLTWSVSLETDAPPKDREEEAAKARARAAQRFGT